MLMCAKQHKLRSTMQSRQTAPQPVFALPFLLQALLVEMLQHCHRPLTRMLPGPRAFQNLADCGVEKMLLMAGDIVCGKAITTERAM